MKDSKQIRKAQEKALIEGLKKSEHPHATSFVIAVILYIIITVIAIIAFALHKATFASAMFTSGIIGIAFAGLWLILRLGIFSGVRLFFINKRNNRIAKSVSPKLKAELTKAEYKELSKTKSWYGMSAFLIASIITTLICGLINFL